jgi:multidrug resistance efflux pump
MGKRLLPIVIVALVLVLLAALYYSQRRRGPLQVSGFIESDEIRVGSRVGGRVAKVPAVEGQAVHRGDLLVELEPYDLQHRKTEAQAQLASRQAEYEKLKAGPRKQEIAAAEARLNQAIASEKLAEQTLARVKANYERNAASRDEFDTAVDQLSVAQSATIVRRQELDQLKEGSRVEDIAEAKAAVEAAEAMLRVIDDQIAELTIESPVNGTVEAVDLQAGDLVAANAPVLSLMDTSRLWVRAYVPENRMNLQVNQLVRVRADSFPKREFKAHVSFISRQAEFTPGNVQTPEERSKQVFRIKVDLDDGLDVLRPGMSADVILD